MEFLAVAIAAYIASVVYNRSVASSSLPQTRYIIAALLIALMFSLVSIAFQHFTAIQMRPLHVLLLSIVGPRPHATAHNKFFQSKIAPFSLRHIVKPRITGWAQVNGLRGETDTIEKMQRRVEDDLYYIDNWSFLLDLKIILLTLLSRALLYKRLLVMPQSFQRQQIAH
jgi:hypothetical protein